MEQHLTLLLGGCTDSVAGYRRHGRLHPALHHTPLAIVRVRRRKSKFTSPCSVSDTLLCTYIQMYFVHASRETRQLERSSRQGWTMSRPGQETQNTKDGNSSLAV